MKTISIWITALGVFALVGCGSNRKPGFGVDELAEIAAAQKESFMGKEVVVSGYVSNISPDLDKDGYTLGLDFDLYSPVERQLACSVPHGQAPEGIRSNWVTVKGRIVNIHSQSYMDLKSVKLEPCEIKHYE